MSDIKRTVLSSFGIRNVGAPQWEGLTFFMTFKILESIKFLFEREFMYAWNRKRFSIMVLNLV